MQKPWALLAALLLAGTTFAFAAEGTDSDAIAKQETKKNPNERVCKRVKETGSNFYRRVCLKRERWDEMQKATQDELGRVYEAQSPSK